MGYTMEQAKAKVAANIGSLEELCKEAICTADMNLMLALNFPETASRKLCSIIRDGAEELRVQELEKHFRRSLERGSSNIINLLVRKKHRLYFASRSNLHPMRLLDHLNAGNEDMCAYMFNRSSKLADALLEKRRNVVWEKRVKIAMRQCDHVVDPDDVTLCSSGEEVFE